MIVRISSQWTRRRFFLCCPHKSTHRCLRVVFCAARIKTHIEVYVLSFNFFWIVFFDIFFENKNVSTKFVAKKYTINYWYFFRSKRFTKNVLTQSVHSRWLILFFVFVWRMMFESHGSSVTRAVEFSKEKNTSRRFFFVLPAWKHTSKFTCSVLCCPHENTLFCAS